MVEFAEVHDTKCASDTTTAAGRPWEHTAFLKRTLIPFLRRFGDHLVDSMAHTVLALQRWWRCVGGAALPRISRAAYAEWDSSRIY